MKVLFVHLHADCVFHCVFLECLAVVTVLLASLTTFVGTLSAAKILHQHILYNVMRTPVSFFDITPVGRILNRLTKDVDTLDNVLPMTLRGWANCFFSVRKSERKESIYRNFADLTGSLAKAT